MEHFFISHNQFLFFFFQEHDNELSAGFMSFLDPKIPCDITLVSSSCQVDFHRPPHPLLSSGRLVWACAMLFPGIFYSQCLDFHQCAFLSSPMCGSRVVANNANIKFIKAHAYWSCISFYLRFITRVLPQICRKFKE